MTLSSILENSGASFDASHANDDVRDLIFDSRTENPKQNSIFVCIKGFTFDSHDHAKKMYDKGVRYFVSEKQLDLPADAVVAVCQSTRIALATMSAVYFKNPAKELTTIALTGTKGKTSTSFMIKNILEKAGHKVGVIGTTGIYYGDVFIDSENSTPESYYIHKYFRDMKESGVDTVVMETSSQGFKLFRTHGILFDIGVFTNLSPDHIGENEHESFEEYLDCKKTLFSQCKTGIFNSDDSHFEEISDGCTCNALTFGYGENCDFTASNPSFSAKNGALTTSYTLKANGKSDVLSYPIPGETSVYNSLCAAAVTLTLGCSVQNVKDGLESTVIRGRNELVDIKKDFSVILDYAHNEASVESVFKTLSHYRKGKIITVFGCGGNRSRLRRFAMGDIISKNSEITIVTSDNPRFEKLESIIDDIMSGIKTPLGEVMIIKDRRQAIYHALSLAKENDIVLIVGKGNQDYEEIEGIKYPFDERIVVKDYFKNASR